MSDARAGTEAPFVPARATLALDAAGLYGPNVDIECGTWEGNPDGDVDAWELGEAVPTAEQVALMAELTGRPVGWFYAPLVDHGVTAVWVCGKTGAKGMGRQRCERVPLEIVAPAAAREPRQGALF